MANISSSPFTETLLSPESHQIIVTVQPDGTHFRQITHFQGGDVKATVGSYSPDGQWIVFSECCGNHPLMPAIASKGGDGRR